MEWLNYHHLLYFWTVAREGGVGRAAEALNLAQPTVSAQLKRLEESLGEALFARRGRGLALTATGELVYAYAEEIFSLGRELLGAVRQGITDRPLRLQVGLVDAVPKSLARLLLQPALALARPVHVVVTEGKLTDLVADLVVSRLDVVLSDARVSGTLAGRIFHHELGDCGVTFLAAPPLAGRLRPGFPASLDGAPAILPTENTALRSSLERWFAARNLQPRVVAEVEDSALIKDLAEDGLGFFVVPDLVADAVRRRHRMVRVGQADDCRESVVAITAERRLTHPAVQAVTAGTRERLAG
ncbi:MAG: LysR family transcriptional regulator [Candidatus Krumholzibacteriia bacterium]